MKATPVTRNLHDMIAEYFKATATDLLKGIIIEILNLESFAFADGFRLSSG